MWTVALLMVFMLVASVTDVKSHKIYNWTVYPGMVVGLVANLWLGGWDGSWEHGWDGLRHSGTGFLICGVVMLVCFVFFDVGGGDVKLVAMMGAFLGTDAGIEAMLWTFTIGSIMGMAILIWQLGFIHIVGKTLHHLRLVSMAKGWVPLTEEERKPLGRWLFLAPSGLIAVGVVVGREWMRHPPDWSF